MQDHRPNGRVEIGPGRVAVGEVAHRGHPAREPVGGGRYVKDLPILIGEQDALVGPPEAARRRRIIKGPLRHPPVDLEDEALGEPLVLQVPNHSHREVVIVDHPLAPVRGRTAAPDHLLGDVSRRRRAFDLARGDRLFNQRFYNVMVFGLRARHLLRELNPPMHVGIDEMQALVEGIDQRIGEIRPEFIIQGDRFRERPSSGV